MSALVKQFKSNWAYRGWTAYTQPVLLAVSGGADSMVMGDLFLKLGIGFGMAHCNFQLRGEEADNDEYLVRDWCIANNIRFHNIRFDTKAKMEYWKKGVQETARILRYEWLEMIRKQHGYAALATAHHANDNAETLLMNLFKGTGMSGLHAIPAQNGHVIRPILFAVKKDIVQYANDNAVPYRNDASNLSDKYLRNDIRLNLLPAIEKRFPNIIANLNNSIQRFTEAEKLYERSIAKERRQLLQQRGKDWYIPVRKLEKREALHTIVYELFSPFGFAPGQVHDLLSLLSSETGHYVSSSTHRVLRNRDFLIVTVFDTRYKDFNTIEQLPLTFRAGDKQYKFRHMPPPAEILADENTAWIDADKLEQPLVLRPWKQGDYFYPLGMGMKKKKLSRYLVDKKLPLHEKEKIMVLESNKRIVWVAGYRLDERFKITPSTTLAFLAKQS